MLENWGSVLSFGMQAPRPYPQCTQTMAAASACCECVVCLCLSVPEAPPPVSLRHVRNAVGEVGDDREESGNKGQEDGIFRTRQFAESRECVCVNVHYLLSILNEKVTSWLALV